MGRDDTAQQVNPPLGRDTSHSRVGFCVLSALLPSQLPATAGEIMCDGSRVRVPSLTGEAWMEFCAPCFCFA